MGEDSPSFEQSVRHQHFIFVPREKSHLKQSTTGCQRIQPFHWVQKNVTFQQNVGSQSDKQGALMTNQAGPTLD